MKILTLLIQWNLGYPTPVLSVPSIIWNDVRKFFKQVMPNI